MRSLQVWLTATCLAIGVSLAAQDLGAHIHKVENGLRLAVAIKGQPPSGMTITERLQHYKVAGASVAVVSQGKVEWARGYGVASAAGGPRVTPETLFQAASISKPVAAMVALRLVEQGKLSLDEEVNSKLRSWKVPDNDFQKTEKVTLRRLLNHSAGLTVHGFRGYAAGEPVPSLVELLDGKKPANSAAVRVDITPGSRWRYAGGGYEVMQQLVEDATGKPFPQVAKELVLDPLRMTHSTYEQPLPARLASSAATGHRRDGTPLKGGWHAYPEMAAAGLWTTPSDLALAILEIQKGGSVLQPATVRQMLTKLTGDYGLGFSLGEKDGVRSFSHGGANEGFRCILFAYMEGGRGAVVMTNGDAGGALANEILRGIAVEYGWPDYRPQEKSVVKVDASLLESYAGKYQFSPGPLVTIAVETGRLFAQPGTEAKVEMLAEAADSFFDPQGVLPALHFTRRPDGPVELSAAGQIAKRQ